VLVLERADCAYGYRRNHPATNTGMGKNARTKTGTRSEMGTRSETGSARTSTGLLLIRVLTHAHFVVHAHAHFTLTTSNKNQSRHAHFSHYMHTVPGCWDSCGVLQETQNFE